MLATAIIPKTFFCLFNLLTRSLYRLSSVFSLLDCRRLLDYFYVTMKFSVFAMQSRNLNETKLKMWILWCSWMAIMIEKDGSCLKWRKALFGFCENQEMVIWELSKILFSTFLNASTRLTKSGQRHKQSKKKWEQTLT